MPLSSSAGLGRDPVAVPLGKRRAAGDHRAAAPLCHQTVTLAPVNKPSTISAALFSADIRKIDAK